MIMKIRRGRRIIIVNSIDSDQVQHQTDEPGHSVEPVDQVDGSSNRKRDGSGELFFPNVVAFYSIPPQLLLPHNCAHTDRERVKRDNRVNATLIMLQTCGF